MSTLDLELKKDLRLFKSLAIAILGEGKGEYKKSFVTEILESADKESVGSFSNKKDFLKMLKK